MLLLGLGSYSAEAQEKTITGLVTDLNGGVLPGVNIIQKGTYNGVVTDFDGNYTIKLVKGSNILVYSYTGFKTIEQQIGENSVVNIKLIEDSQVLDEVVVIGYGSQTKKDMTGSISFLKSDELLKSSPQDIAQGLQGKLAGVKISSDSGAPGSSSSISIRGINSISAGSSPLYINVDDWPYLPIEKENQSYQHCDLNVHGSGNRLNHGNVL